MISFQIDDMSCGHCVGNITKALQAVDAQAQLQFDLPQHQLHIEGAPAQAAVYSKAISDAGYTPVALDDKVS